MFSCCTEMIQRSFVASNILVGRSLTFAFWWKVVYLIKPIPGTHISLIPDLPKVRRLRPTSILEATKDLWIVSVQHENIRTSNCLLIAALIDSDVTKRHPIVCEFAVQISTSASSARCKSQLVRCARCKPQLVRGANFK